MEVPVFLPKIFNPPFTYDAGSFHQLQQGDCVVVPFGKKLVTGVIWDKIQPTSKKIKIKKIEKKINNVSIGKNLIKFINWFSMYNLSPKGMVLKMCLGDNKNLLKQESTEFKKIIIKKKNLDLNDEQNISLRKLLLFVKNFNVSVLQGTTGSGKTLVYFEVIKEILKENKQALILLPEIFLTDQFKKRLVEYFGFEPAVWHSKITPKNKRTIWQGIIKNKIKLVIGARSSLLLPFNNLGIIVVDEEHDQSYKQDEGLIYNARDMAISRSSFENVPTILVTSVPSLETFNHIKNKKYNITKIKKRFSNFPLPETKIINLNLSKLKKGEFIAEETQNLISEYLKKNEQVLFFLNRRGYAPFVVCKNCGYKYQCPNCAVNLNFHKKLNKLLCHYCGHKSSLIRNCKDNKNCEPQFCGPGVERIFAELKKIYPNKKIEIFSSDTLGKNKSTNELLQKVEKKKIDILVGTQLLSKGFHFPKLNCIVVVDSDFSSHGYDLRSAEKNIQLYHQLCGRAGREGNISTIFFQTYTPDDEVLLNISKNDPHAFLQKELLLRKEKKLPPFYRLISLIISGKDEPTAMKFASNLKLVLPKINNVNILGPVLAPITKLKKKYRCRILIRYPKNLFIQKYLSQSLNKIKNIPGIKLEVDVDPINFS